jgi:hypothetical protein
MIASLKQPLSAPELITLWSKLSCRRLVEKTGGKRDEQFKFKPLA